MDRLRRSLRDLVDLVALFHEQEVNFVSLNDHINTRTATGRFTFNIFASLAEFEREIIRERTKARLDAARARGKKGGRPSGLSAEKLKLALTANPQKSLKTLFEPFTREANTPSQQSVHS